MEFRLLKADEIEVKVKKITKKGAVLLLYKTARTDMNLLDETIGSMFWQSDYKEIKDNLYCGIGILDKERQEWVWKWDCGTESRDDGEGNEKKGEASDAFKRAGFKWGIGRELYTAPFIFADVETEEKNGKFYLKDSFASFSLKSIEYDGNEIKSVVVVDNKGKIVFGKNRAEKTNDIIKNVGDTTDLQAMQIDPQKLAKYYGVTLDKLTAEMKQMAIKQKKGEINIHDLDKYKDELQHQREVEDFKKELKEGK